MAAKYIDHLFKINGRESQGYNGLINAYKDDGEILKKINKIILTKNSGLNVL